MKSICQVLFLLTLPMFAMPAKTWNIRASHYSNKQANK